MKNVVRVLTILAAFSLSACRSDDTATPPPNQTIDRSHESNRMRCDAGADPYACLRKACQNAQASFNEADKTCSCEEGSLFFATFGGACIGASATNDLVLDYLYDIGKHYYVVDLQRALPAQQRARVLATRSIPVFAGRSQLTLFKDSASFSQLDDGFNDQLITLGFPTTELTWTSINEGFKNANMMLEAAHQFFILPSEKPMVLPDDSSNARLERALGALKASLPMTASQVRSFSELGCAEICLEKTMLYETDEAKAYRLRVFSGGNPIQDSINVFNKTKLEVESQLVLFNGKPSHYFVSQGRGRYDLYGNDGLKIKTVQEAVPPRPMPRYELGTLAQTPVALFEGFYSPAVDSVALYGPHVNTSYYGWFSQEEARPFYYAKVPTLLGEEDYTTPVHSHAVAKIASANFENPLLPLSLTTLPTGEFPGLVAKLGGLKLVASLSAAFSNTAAVCQQGEIAHAIQGTRETVLWSVGAGNQGSEISDRDIPFCPQSLTGKNLLIVSATSGKERLSSASSYGESYADIAVSGCAFEEETCEFGATSYAAPRLARVAADLMDEFPQLSIANIRIAMLVTARVPYEGGSRKTNRYLQVKSGGLLDPQAASTFLRELSASPLLDLGKVGLEGLSQPQINVIRDALLTARRQQYAKLRDAEVLKLVNDHMNRLMNFY